LSEVDQVRELAERFLSHSAPGDDHRVRLQVGALPDRMDLPIPPGARLIGSLVREPGWQSDRDIEVVIDTTGSGRDALDFYEQTLKPRGWRLKPEFGPHMGGFMAGPMGEGRMLRKDGEPVALFIGTHDLPGNKTEVRIRTQWFPPDEELQHPPHLEQGLIPPLRAPAGVRMQGGGGGGGGGDWTSNAAAETTLTVAELEAHFARQLVEAGWKRIDGSAAGPLAWSSWSLPGKGEHIGYLFVIDAPGENRRSLWVKTEAPRRSYGAWSTVSSSLSSL
jgi:hypothetical protein